MQDRCKYEPKQSSFYLENSGYAIINGHTTGKSRVWLILTMSEAIWIRRLQSIFDVFLCSKRKRLPLHMLFDRWRGVRVLASEFKKHKGKCNISQEMRPYRGRNSVTIQRRWGDVTAPINSKTFGCLSLFINETFRKKKKQIQHMYFKIRMSS